MIDEVVFELRKGVDRFPFVYWCPLGYLHIFVFEIFRYLPQCLPSMGFLTHITVDFLRSARSLSLVTVDVSSCRSYADFDDFDGVHDFRLEYTYV